MLSLPAALSPQALQAEAAARSSQFQTQGSTRAQSEPGAPKDPKAAATELGSLFVLQVLQAMRRTVPKGGLLEKGFAHETYMSMFDQEIAKHIAQREDLGLNAILQRQLHDSTSHNGHDKPAPTRGLAKDAALDAYRQQGSSTDSAFIAPLVGRQTSGFGPRTHPIHQDERLHKGVDLAAPAGTPIRAAAAGEVVFSGTQAGYGNVVIVQHAGGYSTLYAHNAAHLVTVGSPVQQGQAIATVGQTGDATGPHVHFEIRQHDTPLDPAPFLAASPRHKKVV